MADVSFTKWVACWGTATSISNRTEAVWAKDLTLRYPIRVVFSGSKLRFHFSNLTGTEEVKITRAFVAVHRNTSDSCGYQPVPITLNQKTEITIPVGKEVCSDEIEFAVDAGETIDVSLYFADFTQMNAGTFVEGPLSKGSFAYGDFSCAQEFPKELSRATNWFYFLNTVDVLTEKENRALICYGDSITAQSWPDYLAIRAWENGFRNVAIIRRAVCGTRILRQYDCLTYAAYGLKGETRFSIEMKAAGADAVIIQHGINDIIHPVGVETNIFRPWSDMPTAADLEKGVQELYLSHAKKLGYKVWSGTLLPIYGWRTYEPFREGVRVQFNEWLRTWSDFDGCVDFDKALRDSTKPEAFVPCFDSGDHLHPSDEGYRVMAETVPEELLGAVE